MNFSDAFRCLSKGMDEFKGLSVKTLKINKSQLNEITTTEDVYRFRDSNCISICKLNDETKFISKFPPILSFSNLSGKIYKFNPILLKNLIEMGYERPMPVQSESIPLLNKGHHLVVSAPTGSGKTLAFLLPILDSLIPKGSDPAPDETSCLSHKISPLCIILCPSQELVRQTLREAIRLGEGLFPEHGKLVLLRRNHYKLRRKGRGVKLFTSRSGSRELRLPRDTKLLITTPKRLVTLLMMSFGECPFKLDRLQWLIIDECDKMLEVNLAESQHVGGRLKSFRAQLGLLLSAIRGNITDCHQSGHFPTVALFSATVPDEIANWACAELTKECSDSRSLLRIQLGIRDTTVATVKQELRYCGNEQGKLFEMQSLLISGLRLPCLIFMESRKRAHELLMEILLQDNNILANILSSDKSEAQRAATIQAFRDGKINLLICTDLLGRGLDFKGLSMVVNYDLPASSSDYIHRVGRTGRGGAEGLAITLWTDADLPHMTAILEVLRRSDLPVDEDLQRLVLAWRHRKARQTHTKVSGGVISRRRGERRLATRVIGQRKRKRAGEPHSFGPQLLRPWNPHRGNISDVPGSRAGRLKKFDPPHTAEK